MLNSDVARWARARVRTYEELRWKLCTAMVCVRPFSFPLQVSWLSESNDSGNLFGIIFVLVEGALRAPPTASPPLNMHKALIFSGAFIMATCFAIFFIHGKQARREMDIKMGGERRRNTEEVGTETER